ncbi:hypothetical protein ELQ35_14045 [Peribacillus cavernae]|uniref:VCBS repeat-containing protein n=1 Tax=Peribacillus cavernae TaxID=1674310 RepID=A0A3S1B3Y1_9BACI|nr:hypothetical protein [Peribacillus cavernae]MDQ0220471.1 hypothetical protein [Peribacillus cavernae]RUQ28027.1 hypothetical protein ELQ35_14045 [Peribacillus cavernae]
MKTGRRPDSLLKFLFIFSCVLFSYQAVAAGKTPTQDAQTIVTKALDVTGDGKVDSISIKGVPYEQGSKFLKEIKLVVNGGKAQKVSVSLDAGYEPKLQFADFNRDGVDDVFITIPTGSSGGLVNSYAYTFLNDKAFDLTVPPPVAITGQFLDNYKAAISVPLQKTITLDVSDRKKDYERIGLYQLNGKLNEPTEVMVDPYSVLNITDIQGLGQGLKGIQRVSGAYHADGLADVSSEWVYRKGKWELLLTKTKAFTDFETTSGHKENK